MSIAPVYEQHSPPAALGYGPDVRVTIRANPTRADWAAFLAGVGAMPGEAASDKAEREARLLGALVALYSQTQAAGLAFGSIAEARATYDDPGLPDEIWYWLLSLPYHVVGRRQSAILKNGDTSSGPTT